MIKSSLSVIQNISCTRYVKRRIYSLPVHVHKHQLYLLEQHSESLNIWSAIIRINT